VTIDLPPELEKALRQQAARNGQDVSAFVLQAVQEKIAKARALDEICNGVPAPDLPEGDPFWVRMQAVWAGQQARGHAARSVQDVEADRQALREEWEQRMRRLEQIQAEANLIREARRPGP
jgi:hypothetical protein